MKCIELGNVWYKSKELKQYLNQVSNCRKFRSINFAFSSVAFCMYTVLYLLMFILAFDIRGKIKKNEKALHSIRYTG